MPIKLAWMYLSLPVGLGLMTLVNVELIIKQFYKIWDPERELPRDPDQPVSEDN